jgi:hypothetical protein
MRTLAIVAIVIALGLLGIVVAYTVVDIPQVAKAG